MVQRESVIDEGNPLRRGNCLEVAGKASKKHPEDGVGAVPLLGGLKPLGWIFAIIASVHTTKSEEKIAKKSRLQEEKIGSLKRGGGEER